MWHNNKKNPLVVNAPKPPAPLNASAKTNTAIKFATPEIRVGLNATSGSPKSSMIEQIGTKKHPLLTNAISKPAKTLLFKSPKMPKAKSMPRRPLAK